MKKLKQLCAALKQLWIEIRCGLGFHYWVINWSKASLDKEKCRKCGETR